MVLPFICRLMTSILWPSWPLLSGRIRGYGGTIGGSFRCSGWFRGCLPYRALTPAGGRGVDNSHVQWVPFSKIKRAFCIALFMVITRCNNYWAWGNSLMILGIKIIFDNRIIITDWSIHSLFIGSGCSCPSPSSGRSVLVHVQYWRHEVDVVFPHLSQSLLVTSQQFSNGRFMVFL